MSRIQMPVRLPAELYNELKGRAHAERRSMNKVIEEVLLEALTRPEPAGLA